MIGKIVSVDEVDEITIELTSGGTIEGEVIVAPAQNREGLVVGCSRQDGRPTFTRTDKDGRYRFENLTPGPWLIEGRKVEPEGRSSSSASLEDAPFEPSVYVEEGTTSYFDLDLRWLDGLAVTGRLTIDGRGAQGFTAQLVSRDGGDYGIAPVTLDKDGNFECPASPGQMTLAIGLSEQDIDWSLTHKIFVGPNTQPVELELTTASLQGTGRLPNQAIRVQQFHESGDEITVDFKADENGAFSEIHVPSGRLRILQMVKHEQYGNVYSMLSETTVAAGETHVVTADKDE